ncbi:hypothetical protein WJX79_009799 [Trebouxia sp. C0005]
MLHCCLGQILSRCPTSALLTGLTRNKLPCRASAENRPAAAASNADSADVPNMDRNALEPTVPAGATQNASDAAKAPDLSSPLQAQEKPSLAKCVPKTPITTPDVVITASQAPFKFSSLPVPQSKPTNATGGAALHGFPKLSARISGGSTRSPDVPLPSFGSTPVQTAARSKPSGMSSDPTVLPGPQCVTIAVSLSKSAGAAAIPVRLPVSSVPAVPKAASPQLPVPGPAHSIDTDQQLSPIAGITRTPPVKQAQQQQPSLPQTSGPAVSASHRDVQMSAPVEQDAVMGKEGENSLPTTKPWTSTSLAGGLMGNMKNLEAMLFEVQQMHDDILECKVDVAISSNRLTRLDNPIVHDKLRSLKRQAETVFQATAEE